MLLHRFRHVIFDYESGDEALRCSGDTKSRRDEPRLKHNGSNQAKHRTYEREGSDGKHDHDRRHTS